MSTPAPAPASASPLPDGITDPNYKPLPGRLGNLSVPQQHALDTLKKVLQAEGAFVPERMDDATLLRCVRPSRRRRPRARACVCQRPIAVLIRPRFLRARKFDVPKAKEMILSAEAWREDFGVDDLVECVPPSPLLRPSCAPLRPSLTPPCPPQKL